jgi:hypothetical protein
MWIPIFTPLISAISDIGGKWLDKQRAVADGAITVAVATAQAKATIAVAKATSEIEWEAQMARNSATSWKDEAWTIFFIAVLTLSFIPGMDKYIQQGFSNIAQLPDWFGYAVMLAISAAFGKNIVKDFQSLANNRRGSTMDRTVLHQLDVETEIDKRP